MRADTVTEAMVAAVADGSIPVFTGLGISDLLVHDRTLRDLPWTLAVWAAGLGMPTIAYSEADGASAKNTPDGPKARVPSLDTAIPPSIALDTIFEQCSGEDEEPTLILIDWVEAQVSDDGQGFHGDAARIIEQLASKATDQEWIGQGHRIALLARTGQPDQRLLRLPGFPLVELGLPDEDERALALTLMQASTRKPLALADGLSAEHAARLAGGLTIDALSRMRHRHSDQNPITISALVAGKNQQITAAAGSTLVVHTDLPDLATDVAGMPQVKRRMAEATRRGRFSQRLILTGPPGVGKSWVAKALAASAGLPALELGRVEAKWVGESQDNLRRAFDVLTANLPACLILDEVDQSVLARRGSGSGGDGGDGASVKGDLRNMFFTFLGDNAAAGLMVVAMTNRPDLLDEASADRFEMVPIVHPSPNEAAEIVRIQTRRMGIDVADDDGAIKVLEASGETYSGRQLVRLADTADISRSEAGRSHVELQDWMWAEADTIESLGAGEELMALLAIATASNRRLLPWIAAAHAEQPYRMPTYLEPFVRTDGSVDFPALNARINELRGRHG